MFSALATAGGGTAARESAKARSASRALCGVITVGSRNGNSGMIWAMTGSSGVTMSEASCWTGLHHRSRVQPRQFGLPHGRRTPAKWPAIVCRWQRIFLWRRNMRRREFLTMIGGTVVAWPVAAAAQARMRRVAVLMLYAESDPQGQVRAAAFRQGLESAGWVA